MAEFEPETISRIQFGRYLVAALRVSGIREFPVTPERLEAGLEAAMEKAQEVALDVEVGTYSYVSWLQDMKKERLLVEQDGDRVIVGLGSISAADLYLKQHALRYRGQLFHVANAWANGFEDHVEREKTS